MAARRLAGGGGTAHRGVDMRAVTAWSLLGAFDWNSLLTRRAGCYESGVFDLRGPQPRATGLASLIREFTSGHKPTHPTLCRTGGGTDQTAFFTPRWAWRIRTSKLKVGAPVAGSGLSLSSLWAATRPWVRRLRIFAAAAAWLIRL